MPHESPRLLDCLSIGLSIDADGMLPIPDSPGLGVSINPDAVEKYTGGRFA